MTYMFLVGQKHKAKRKVISVALSGDDHREIERYAKAQELKLSALGAI